jgi:glycerol-3-phosphate dehydrogenase
LSKGTHLVFREEDVPLSVTTVFSSPLDGRPLFLVRREGCFLYGTTDDWEEAEPDAPEPKDKDVAYLLESLRRFMPDAGLDRTKVRFVYSGFRPLLSLPGRPVDPSKAKREDCIEESPSGLITVAGGKLTTARLMAIRVLKRVLRQTGSRPEWSRSRTGQLSLGGDNRAVATGLAKWVKRCPQMAAYFRVLYDRYGLDADGICAEALRIHLKQHPDPRAEPIRAEAQYVCRHEMVCTLEDLMERRAGFLHWTPDERVAKLLHGATVICEELGLSETEFQAQLAAYRQYLARFHTLPGGPGATA